MQWIKLFNDHCSFGTIGPYINSVNSQLLSSYPVSPTVVCFSSIYGYLKDHKRKTHVVSDLSIQ